MKRMVPYSIGQARDKDMNGERERGGEKRRKTGRTKGIKRYKQEQRERKKDSQIVMKGWRHD